MKITAIFSILLIVHQSLSWRTAGKLTNALKKGLPEGLQSYSLTSYTPLNIIILHGGNNGTDLLDRTFILNLTISQILEVHSSIKPAARSNPCTYAVDNSLFLFGGKLADGEIAQDSLWQLDFTSFQWQLLPGSANHFSVCQIFPSSNGLVLIGDSIQSQLAALYFSFASKSYVKLAIDFYRYALFEVTQWDGTSASNYIDIESSLSFNISNFQKGEFPFDNSSYLRIMSTKNQSEFVMRVNNNIYRVYHENTAHTFVIRFKESDIQRSKSQNSQFVYWNGWNICGILENEQFFLTFDRDNMTNSQRVDLNSKAYYSNNWPIFPSNSSYYSLMMFTSSPVNKTYLVLVIHIVQQVYLLPENVFSELNIADATNPVLYYPIGVAFSFFGINKCKQGYTGRNCTIKSCINSLKLYGNNNVSVINFECSGHGKCIDGVCQCDSYWGGADCSTYLRKSCGGTLLDNFPLRNCECFNSTVGGNSCLVIFCPNDCSGRGKCQNGICSCDSTYYGSDCSIMIVGFPS